MSKRTETEIADVCLRIIGTEVSLTELQKQFPLARVSFSLKGDAVPSELQLVGVTKIERNIFLIGPPSSVVGVSEGIEWTALQCSSKGRFFSQFLGKMDLRINCTAIQPHLHEFILLPSQMRIFASLGIVVHCSYWMPLTTGDIGVNPTRQP